MHEYFDWGILSQKDRLTAQLILGDDLRDPDFIIAPDGKPYLYRWFVIPRNRASNVYLHIQVASDPDRPLHDHPWDNMSVILAGGYEELIGGLTPSARQFDRDLLDYTPTSALRRPGDVIFRTAERLHRLILPDNVPYTMTLFSTGPNRRDWGFMCDEGWLPASTVLEQHGKISTVKAEALDHD